MMVRNQSHAGRKETSLGCKTARVGVIDSRSTSRLLPSAAMVRCLVTVSLFWVHSTSFTTGQLIEVTSRTIEADSPAEAEAAAPTLPELQTQTQLNIQRLNKILRSQESLDSNVAAYATEEVELWEELELVIDQRTLIQQDLAALENSATASGDADIPTEELPKSYFEFEEFRNQVLSSEQNLIVLDLELHAEKNMQARVSERYRDAEKERRRLAEAMRSSKLPELEREHALAVLRSKVLAHRLAMHREQTAITARKIEAAEKLVAKRQGLQTALKGKFKLTREELENHLAKFGDFEETIRLEMSSAEKRMQQAIRERSLNPDAAANLAYELVHDEVQLFQHTLSEAKFAKECWQRRYQLSAGQASVSEIAVWLEESEQAKERVSHLAEKIQIRTMQRKQELSELDRVRMLANTTQTNSETNMEVAELEKVINVYSRIESLVIMAEHLYSRFIEDLEAQQDGFSLTEWMQVASTSIAACWQYEIANIDDQAITIGKVVSGILLLLIGYFASRAFASIVASRILPKFGLSHAAASVFRTLLFYSLIIALALVTLDIINVPLTVFAFLGGAVAIGFGFGSQNLVNNFISGLILLAERPIRVGDLVNVDGIDANVTNIGARSTKVRTGSNLEILVPNSKFLENNVTNWTLSDTRVRTSVCVGVAYGSPVREVIHVLKKVIDQHELVIRSPEPIVLFKEFADSALTFEVHFWIHMKRMMDGEQVRSEIRVAMDDAFRDAGIVIAFPQRDVHVDMQTPIEVRLADLQNVAKGSSGLRRAA
jgi:potassium efflux system protein